MGVYYKFINRDRRERIELADLDPPLIKRGAVIFGSPAHLLTFLHVAKRQPGWTAIGDYSEEYHDVGVDFADVTREIVGEYNEEAGEMSDFKLHYRGPE